MWLRSLGAGCSGLFFSFLEYHQRAYRKRSSLIPFMVKLRTSLITDYFFQAVSETVPWFTFFMRYNSGYTTGFLRSSKFTAVVHHWGWDFSVTCQMCIVNCIIALHLYTLHQCLYMQGHFCVEVSLIHATIICTHCIVT